MRKTIFFIIFSLIAVSLAFAQTEEPAKEVSKSDSETIKLSGTIVDNKSVEKYLDGLDNFMPRYPKAQAILPSSVESGYSIYSAGELYRFNKESNDKISEFLQERNNVLRVEIEARKDGDDLDLISIKNEYIGVMGNKNE